MAALLGAPPPWPQQPQLGQQGRGGQDSQAQAQVAPLSPLYGRACCRYGEALVRLRMRLGEDRLASPRDSGSTVVEEL